MEVSTLKYSRGIGLHGRSPLLRLQPDDRLIGFVRKGNTAAFEALVARYETRLLAFCRHLLGSREDAEDVLQEVMAAAFNAILADDRPINVRPWLYRIARNRSLNHLRRIQAVGVDSMDIHFSDNGASTADKVHDRDEFRLLVGDIHELPETQKTALVLREMDALSYEQIAEAMETTVPSVKSLLVRARVSLAEASEARLLSCEHVRIELAEVAEGLRRRPDALVRRHLRGCKRCSTFRTQLKQTNKALAALLPVGPLALLKKVALTHLGHSAGSGASAAGASSSAGAAGAGVGAAGSTAVASSTVAAGSATGGFVSAGIGAIATKAAAGLAAAALVTAGAVEVDHTTRQLGHRPSPTAVQSLTPAVLSTRPVPVDANPPPDIRVTPHKRVPKARGSLVKHAQLAKPAALSAALSKPSATASAKAPLAGTATSHPAKPVTAPGHTQTQSDPTVVPSAPARTTSAPTPSTGPASGTPTSGSVDASSTTSETGTTSTPVTAPATGAEPDAGTAPSLGSVDPAGGSAPGGAGSPAAGGSAPGGAGAPPTAGSGSGDTGTPTGGSGPGADPIDGAGPGEDPTGDPGPGSSDPGHRPAGGSGPVPGRTSAGGPTGGPPDAGGTPPIPPAADPAP